MSSAENRPAPRWQPLPPLDRRVAAVLVEKAKTTPDAYPMSINALRAGCNQKNNRDPVMEVDEDAVQESLDRLRGVGLVAEVQGGGRVPRYRHYMYDWLGVDKVEVAVMTELLLRGEQTEGELRGRVSRMEPIADLPALRAVLNALKAKGLVIALSPEGRGYVVTHALYPPRELERLKSDFQRVHGADFAEPAEPAPAPVRTSPPAVAAPVPHYAPVAQPVPTPEGLADLRRDVSELKQQVAALRDELSTVRSQCDSQQRELESLRSALGG
ncbi:MAG: DUF480 domain-containing protein [Planctomycetia bacterium]|nr:DUF480 domain-containing protein [Planctomycetia bacterium]